MHAGAWHRLLIARPVEAPAPLTAAKLDRLNQRARDEYAQAVSDWFAQEWFASDLVDGVIAGATARIEANRRSPIGAKEIVAIHGPYGVGKTSTILRLSRTLYPHYVRGEEFPSWCPDVGIVHDLVPVMWVQLQAGSTLKTLYGSLLDFLRFPVHGTGNALASRALSALARFGVQVLILDDVHKLRESQQASRDIIDALHTINTSVGERGGTLCLVGSEMEQRALLNHPQIDSRLKTMHLPPFTVGQHADRVLWQKFLRGVEDLCGPYLPGNEPGFLALDLPAYIHARTQGFMQDVQQLLKDGMRVALAEQVPALNRGILARTQLSERAQRAEALLRSKPTTRVRAGRQAAP